LPISGKNTPKMTKNRQICQFLAFWRGKSSESHSSDKNTVFRCFADFLTKNGKIDENGEKQGKY
jgi:hypothetical protein